MNVPKDTVASLCPQGGDLSAQHVDEAVESLCETRQHLGAALAKLAYVVGMMHVESTRLDHEQLDQLLLEAQLAAGRAFDTLDVEIGNIGMLRERAPEKAEVRHG